MQKFKRTTKAFNYIFEKALAAGETVIIEVPEVSAHKMGICDIGWQSDGDIEIYGTLSENPCADDALWQEINEGNEINRTVSGLKIVAGTSACRVVVRIIMG